MNKVEVRLPNFEATELKNIVNQDNELKNFLVNYVSKKLNSKDVTVEMIVEIMAKEFPDFLLVVAEENFIRGYEQAMVDMDDDQEDFKKNKRKK